jgi:RsiW-degrading membrane proteinase PrsW (M82 family)
MATDQYVACLRQLSAKGMIDQRQPVHALSSSEPLILGRDGQCQVSLNPALYRSVSRKHAEISPIRDFIAPDGMRFWQICDLGSSNGTYINGKRIDGCQVLRAGDRIMLGQNGPQFLFECESSQEWLVLSESSIPQNGSSNLPIPLYPTAPPPKHPLSKGRESSVSLTQLFPILSTGRELTQKAYLMPAMVTIVFVVMLFISIGNPPIFNLLLASYLAIAAYYFIYQLCGKHKPWWAMVGVATTTILLLISPTLELFTLVFHKLLPGNPANVDSANFVVKLIKMFFGAGLMEELLKAVPIVMMVWFGKLFRPPWRERLGVWEPLDGILLGAASAVGFALMETLGVYVPATYHSSLGAGQEAAQLAGLQLLIPRVLGLVAGHMAYSGYLGYFVGLSMLRRRQRWLILGVGYLSASLLHTLWNAAGLLSPVFLAVVGVASYACLGAAILKARALSPTRSQNFATRFFQ